MILVPDIGDLQDFCDWEGAERTSMYHAPQGFVNFHLILEDQHMEWKPAGQPEHASLNQCQLIVANRCSGHPQLGWR